MTWLGALNFVVLQWFGVRLARVVESRPGKKRLERMEVPRDGGAGLDLIYVTPVQYVTVGWRLLRYVWPLTGWRNDYRWIWRRGSVR